ncbi:fasciculation and elongation zeta-2-like protein, partial [Euroglyphus maynei]
SNRSSQHESITPVIDADQVIKEIESLYASNQSTPSKRYSDSARQRQLNKTDPLLSLDAATLLDVALQNWQSNNNRLSADDYDVNLETFEYCHDDQEYHSLPADLNSDILDQVTVSSSVVTATADQSHRDNPSLNEQTSSICGEQQLELVNKLNQLTIVQLNELYMELEQIIQIRSEVLIQELALRDELEYEKEQKNQ